MRLAIAAGILAHALPAESGKNGFLGDGMEKKKRIIALLQEQDPNNNVRFSNQRSLKRGKRSAFASTLGRKPRNERVLKNDNLPKDEVECDPNPASDADVGLLSCGTGQYCLESLESKLGGVCIESDISDQRLLQVDDDVFGIGMDLAMYAKYFCDATSPYYQYYDCNCTDFDPATFTGTVGCVIDHIDCESANITDDYLVYNNATYSSSNRRLNGTYANTTYTNKTNTNSTCGISTLDITAYGEGNFTSEYCIQYDYPSQNYWCYTFGMAGYSIGSLFCDNPDYDCDCSGFDFETATGAVDCILYESYCFDCANTTCAAVAMQMEFYGPSSYNYFVCYDFFSPYDQQVCYQQGIPGEECGTSFNGVMCNQCHQVSDQCAEFNCTNTEIIFEGNTCMANFEFPILQDINSTDLDLCSNISDITSVPGSQDVGGEAPASLTPAPVMPAPAAPAPVTPAPVTPAPITSAPVAPAPISASVTPAPAPASGVPSIISAKRGISLVGLSMALLVYFAG